MQQSATNVNSKCECGVFIGRKRQRERRLFDSERCPHVVPGVFDLQLQLSDSHLQKENIHHHSDLRLRCLVAQLVAEYPNPDSDVRPCEY